MLGMGAYFLVTLFDGTDATVDLQATFSRRFGEIIPLEKIGELVTALDRAYFPRFAGLSPSGYAACARSSAKARRAPRRWPGCAMRPSRRGCAPR